MHAFFFSNEWNWNLFRIYVKCVVLYDVRIHVNLYSFVLGVILLFYFTPQKHYLIRRFSVEDSLELCTRYKRVDSVLCIHFYHCVCMYLRKLSRNIYFWNLINWGIYVLTAILKSLFILWLWQCQLFLVYISSCAASTTFIRFAPFRFVEPFFCRALQSLSAR